MRKLVFAMLLLTLTAAFTFAQSTTGTLLGNVSSPDGLLPGATVTVTDNQTGRELTVVTDENGAFKFERLSFGTYTVKVTQEGFKTYVSDNVKIDANREYSLNPQLEIGIIDEVVNVSAGAEIVNSSNAELSATVSPRQVLDLPINGRNPLSLLNLQAGVNATSSSINGQRSSSANYTRDGINVQDNFIRSGGFVQDRPSVDDTGEFTVTTQNASAAQGNGGSTQVQLVTPRGGKDFHGALFAYNRNSEFAANDFGNNASGTDRPFLNRNQFGGKVSGPVPLPGFGSGGPLFVKDKGYFFVAYERFLLRQTSSIQNRVLLNRFRDGTFTYVDNGGVTRTINVLSGAGLTGPIPGTSGGALTVDPTIQARFLSLTPTAGNAASQTASSGGFVTQDFVFNQNNNDTRNGFTTRFDVDINDRNNVYFVYKYNDNADDRQSDPGGFLQQPFVVQGGPTASYLLSYSTVLGSSFTNEVRGAYVYSNPFFNQSALFPTDFVIGGLPFGLTSPEPSFQDQGRNTDQYTFQDNASYTKGNHTMRFGYEFNRQRIASQTNFNAIPIYNISGTGNPATPGLPSALFPGGISSSDLAIADSLRYLLGGIVGAGSVQANFVDPQTGPVIGAPSLQNYKYDTHGLYFTDQWRATPNLTLNLGLRWDYFTPLENTNQVLLEPDLRGATASADTVRAALLNPNGQYVIAGTTTGNPGQLFFSDKNNFGPVLGFAYTPDFENGFLSAIFGKERQSVIRGGFRIGYINDEYVKGPDNAGGGNDGLNQTISALNPNTGTVSLNSRFNNLPGFILPPFGGSTISFAQGNINNGAFFNTVFAIDPNLEVQRNMEYSLGFQREIGWDTAIEIRYVGGRSNSLVRGFDYNQVDIFGTGFAQDFINAQNNCRIQGATVANPNPFDPIFSCTTAANIGLPGQVDLPVFAQLPFGAFLNNGTVLNEIRQGRAGQLALIYLQNGLDGFFDANNNFVGVQFRANPNAGPVDLLANAGKYRYNALQFEIRRRFTQGLSFQANYTFQKTLSDILTDGQNRFDPFLDNAQQELDYARTNYDRTHTININANYELPFGKGKPFFNQGGWVNALLGGFQVTSIINIGSGPPISIRDPNGTLNRSGRSARQTANSNLTINQIQDLIGIFHQNGRIYFIDPSVIAPNGTATGGNVLPTNSGAFPGQVFFAAQAGQTGNLARSIINGPLYFNWDAGLIKNIAISERMRLQLRAEAFNVLNNVNFFVPTGPSALNVGEDSNIFNIRSSSFGQIPATNNYGPRIMQFAVRFEF
ncbi:MAG: carboxypeptidase regulatory-like domain-containing protein [Pyrinomonadaceae bacterium]